MSPEEQPTSGEYEPGLIARKLRQYTSLDPQESSIPDMLVEGVAGFIPGIGQAMAARDIERGRRANDPVEMGLGAAGLMPWGKLGSVVKKVIGGRLAKNAPHKQMDEVEQAFHSKKRTPAEEKEFTKENWRTKGVEMGKENHAPPKFEISDKGYKLTEKALRMGDIDGRLSDYVDHPELFKNYPHLRDVRISGGFGDKWNYGGEYRHQKQGATYLDIPGGIPTFPEIDASARNAETLRGVILHEIQHAIQATEGFDAGANSGHIADALRKLDKKGKLSDIKIDDVALERYFKNLGEQEARMVDQWKDRAEVVKKQIPPSFRHETPDDFILAENLPGGTNYKGGKQAIRKGGDHNLEATHATGGAYNLIDIHGKPHKELSSPSFAIWNSKHADGVPFAGKDSPLIVPRPGALDPLNHPGELYNRDAYTLRGRDYDTLKGMHYPKKRLEQRFGEYPVRLKEFEGTTGDVGHDLAIESSPKFGSFKQFERDPRGANLLKTDADTIRGAQDDQNALIGKLLRDHSRPMPGYLTVGENKDFVRQAAKAGDPDAQEFLRSAAYMPSEYAELKTKGPLAFTPEKIAGVALPTDPASIDVAKALRNRGIRTEHFGPYDPSQMADVVKYLSSTSD